MANIGQTMFRFCGALLLAGGATLFDHPRLWVRPGPTPIETAAAVVAPKDIPEVKITPGKRAFAIRINDVAGLAGVIRPNSRVDIMVVLDDADNPGKRVAKMFMSNMRLLAIGSVALSDKDGRPINASVATIEVTPLEAEQLAIAGTQGAFQLLLRGYGDPDSVNTLAGLYVVPAPLRRAPYADTARVTVIRSGVSKLNNDSIGPAPVGLRRIP